MKKDILTTISILIATFLIVINTATAEERVRVIKMGESDEIVEFPMTPQEIAADDAENARLAAIRETKLKVPNGKIKIIEMGESGQTVEFPMTSDEIIVEEAENKRLSTIRAANNKKVERKTSVFELAESGHIIFIRHATKEIAAVDTNKIEIIAEKAGADNT